MEMRNFGINTPFVLNWRLVAPRDFETLEYFLTPDLSIVFKGITDGKSPFYIGTFFGQDKPGAEPMTLDKFEREILPQRSQERINNAFKNEEVSCFFTFDESKELEKMFADNGFICRSLEINKNGRHAGLLEIPTEDFHLIAKLFAQLKVVAMMDFEKQAESFEVMYDEIDQANKKKVRHEIQEREWKRRGVTKKSLMKNSGVGATCLAVSATLAGISRRLFSKASKFTFIAGALCMVGSIVAGIIGKKYVEETVEHWRRGMVLEYA